MRPKPPSPPNTPRVDPPEHSAPGPSRPRPDADLPLPHQQPLAPITHTATSEQGHSRHSGESSGSLGIDITDLPTVQPEVGAGSGSDWSLERYVQRIPAQLPPPGETGFRVFKNKKFVDVEGEDKSVQTVMVGFDPRLSTYRAKLPSEQEPSGPTLYRNGASHVWRVEKPRTYFPSGEYTTAPLPDAQGYYEIRYNGAYSEVILNAQGHYEYRGAKFPGDFSVAGFAFRDEDHRWVRADPIQARGDTSVAMNLPHWTDGEIWDLYRLHSAEAFAFRAHGQATGKAPDWARRFEEPNLHLHVTKSLKWLFPQMSVTERSALLQSYNLTMTQQRQLNRDLQSGQFPEWAEQHKRLTLESGNPQRLELIAQELDPHILKLRNEGNTASSYRWAGQRFTQRFLDDYLLKAGYQRNTNNMLFRTDIPAMFRGETRTPFELARDERMIHRRGNFSGTTTKKAFSATFSLRDAVNYAKTMGGYWHELDYNAQSNRYPGVHSGSSVSEGYRHDSGPDSDSSFVLDDSKDYEAARRKQTRAFLYAIDTRGLEVVPGAENAEFNSAHTEFSFDPLEGHISMPTRGLSAERVWLVKSDLSRAARVQDVNEQAGRDAGEIERKTWNGENLMTYTYRVDEVTGQSSAVYQDRYDELIDKVAASGKTVLELPKNRGTYANDIDWPVPEHFRP